MLSAEIESLEQWDARIETDPRLAGVFVQSLDLTGRDVHTVHPQGAVFLGCVLTNAQERSLRDRGALIFPRLPAIPFNPYQPCLYTPADLYNTLPEGVYADSLDARSYAWSRAMNAGTVTPPPTLAHTLATALHDHAIADAQAEFLARMEPSRVVGIMGGHAAARGSASYYATAELARDLARKGRLIASGGGPGAMEAANLGARLSDCEDDVLTEAITHLATVPSFRPSVDAWARVALDVAHEHSAVDSLAIPTWFYGHEPPNVFATHVAKYFSNALREDTLLASCRGGLVYLPGAAGTVQELFQAVTSAYYAQEETQITPLVLVGIEQWTRILPAWPLLTALAQGRAMSGHIHLVDDVSEVLALLC